MEFSNPRVERYVFDHPRLDSGLDLFERFAEAQWSTAQATRLRNDELINGVHRSAGAVADYIQKAQNHIVFNDAPNGVPVENVDNPGGSLLDPPRAPYLLESEFIKLQRREEKSRKDIAEFQRKSRPPFGRMSWAAVSEAAKKLVTDLATRNADIEWYEPKGKASRKGLAEAGKVAEAGHAERKKLMGAYPDRATAESMVRGLTRSPNPMRVQFTGYAMARTLRLPLIDLKWGEGRSAPSPEDVMEALLWLAGERIQEDLIAQLERQYSSFAERGIPTLSEPDRRRELARVDGAIHVAELEEAAHLIGLIEDEGTLLLPPARMSARALLGIA